MKVFTVLYSFFPDISSVKLTRCPLSWLILPQNVSTLQFLLKLGKILKSKLFPPSLGIVALWRRELHIRHNPWLSAAIYCSVKQYKVRVIISIYRAAVFVSGGRHITILAMELEITDQTTHTLQFLPINCNNNLLTAHWNINFPLLNTKHITDRHIYLFSWQLIVKVWSNLNISPWSALCSRWMTQWLSHINSSETSHFRGVTEPCHVPRDNTVKPAAGNRVLHR